jgi:predicted lipoprotein with Yx(FWY)xxD motif
MNDSHEQPLVRASRRRRRRTSTLTVASAAVTAALALSLSATTLGSGLTITSASNSTLGKQIVVDVHGRTLYALSPETTRHLLCKSTECLAIWKPLTVRSSKTKLKAGPGVHGRLAILHRSKGVLQVTLAGMPLYRYAGDTTKGEANGQHIHSFGGTWHVLSATNRAGSTPIAPRPPTEPTPPPGY